MNQAFDYVIANGIETEAMYPYTARDGTCKTDATKQIKKVLTYVDVPANACSQLLAAATAQPVSVAVDASAFQTY